ncbi:MAG: hypothetical protein M2R45_01222 [Verrucomicrobia subdivision 3 bacterium]|nr:hypothetical protein [Limisphaerales bacterium]MCS1415226.1 hypothetical protein [Limisphaerales bacterium]
MIKTIETAVGRLPDELSADVSYYSEDNLEILEAHGIRGTASPPGARSTARWSKTAAAGSRQAIMAWRLKQGERRSCYLSWAR